MSKDNIFSYEQGASNLFVLPNERRAISRKEFGAQVDELNQALRESGITANDVVVLSLRDRYVLLKAIIAVMTRGAIACPVNPDLTNFQIRKILLHSEPKLIVADTEMNVDISEDVKVVDGRSLSSSTPHGASPQNLERLNSEFSRGRLLIYTSGTTDDPKGVLLSGNNLLYNANVALKKFGYQPGHVTCCILPLFHTFGIISDVFTALLAGGTCILADQFSFASINQFVLHCRNYGVNSYSAVPIIFESLVRFKADLALDSLEFAVSGAAPLRESVRQAYFERYGHPIHPCYGLSETTCFATISNSETFRPGSVGKPADVEIGVMDGDRQLGRMITGEIAIKGRSLMDGGYFKNPGANERAFVDGWFLTGDIGTMDADGFVFITGRKKNMVIRGGEKIYLDEITNLVNDLRGIKDCFAIRLAVDDRESCVLLCVPHGNDGSGQDAVIVDCIHKQLGQKYVPDRIIWVDEIKRTSTGKVIYNFAEAQAKAV